MNLPPQQLPSAEEPEQQPVPHTPEEASVQPSSSADQSSEEPEQQPVLHTSEEDISTQPSSSADQPSEETQQQPVGLASEDTTQPASSFEPVAEETETQLAMPSEPVGEETEPQFATFSEADGAEVSEDDEDEVSEPAPSGVFIHKGILIAAASAVVVVALLAVFLVFVNRPKDPPTDWIASYTPPAGSSTTGKVLYYLHWTNQNGELKGQMQLAAFANGAPQSLTVPATGLYNRDNHDIYVVITVQGQADTLTGKINDAGDTMSLNPAGVTSKTSQFVFHIGTANDFKQATKKLGSTAGTK